MKKVLLFLLPALLSLTLYSQDEDPLDVEISAPDMRDLINRLWINLPSRVCTVPAQATVESGSDDCAGIALKHLRYVLSECDISDGFEEAIKTEFKIIKLIPVGKAAGFMLDIADLTVKAITADSPEEFTSDLENYGFGKVVPDEVVGKLKKLLPDDIGTDILGNLTKAYLKHLWAKAKEAILPSAENYTCQPQTEACKDNLHMSIEPYAGEDPGILGMFVFSANGDCACKLACSAGSVRPVLKTWSIHGTMPLIVEKAEVVEGGFFSSTRLRITLTTGSPAYKVQADCDCNDSNTSNISYDEEEPESYVFAGAGFINEDAGDRFNLYGVNAAYTHMITSQLGATGDAGIYFREQGMIRYRRMQLLAGASYQPGNQNGKLVFVPHVLAGIANTHSKIKEAGSDFSASNTNFAAAIGTDVMMELNSRTFVLRADFNPVFVTGGVVNNFRLGVGIRL